MKTTITVNRYVNNEHGVAQHVETTSTEVEVPSPEELIAAKEAQLLAIYEELQALKG